MTRFRVFKMLAAFLAIGPFDIADEIPVVCRSGKRATVAVDSLRLAGFTRSFVVDGGVQAWIEAGFPVVAQR